MEYITAVMNFLKNQVVLASEYPLFVVTNIVIISMVLTMWAKLPVKMLLDKIKNQTVKARLKVLIMLLPFIFSACQTAVLLAFGYKYSGVAVLAMGTTSVFAYEFITRLAKKAEDGEISLDDLTSSVKESFGVTAKALNEAGKVATVEKVATEEQVKSANAKLEATIAKFKA